MHFFCVPVKARGGSLIKLTAYVELHSSTGKVRVFRRSGGEHPVRAVARSYLHSAPGAGNNLQAFTGRKRTCRRDPMSWREPLL